MLARLSMSTARLLDVYFDTSSFVEFQSEQHSEDPESSLVLDFHALRCFITPIPNNAWHRMASACGRTVAPVYTNLQRTLTKDFDNFAKLMLELEVCYDGKADGKVSAQTTPSKVDVAQVTAEENPDLPLDIETFCVRQPSKRRRKSADRLAPHTLVIPSSSPLVPTIVITPAPVQPRDNSCCVPYQDQAFGNLLTIPSHPAFNKVHAPMVHSKEMLPYLNQWKWEDGHWKAIVPSLSEQARRGIFSKPTSISRRKFKNAKSSTQSV